MSSTARLGAIRRDEGTAAVDHAADGERPLAAEDLADLAAGDHQRRHHQRVQGDRGLDAGHGRCRRPWRPSRSRRSSPSCPGSSGTARPPASSSILRHGRSRYKAESKHLVFRSPPGQAVRPGLVRRRFWNPAVAAADPVPLRVHDLRHTAVALWIAAGANPKQIAVRAGHTSVSVVLGRYSHLFPEQDELLMSALERGASGFAPPPPTKPSEQ